MIVALLLSISLGASQQAPTATPQPDPKLIRVHVQTDETGDATELAARRESVKHLSAAIAGKTKAGLVVADAEDTADVVVNVGTPGSRSRRWRSVSVAAWVRRMDGLVRRRNRSGS